MDAGASVAQDDDLGDLTKFLEDCRKANSQCRSYGRGPCVHPRPFPQRGTLTAQWIPRWLLAGLADMKRGSALLRSLNADPSLLQDLDCVSCFCGCDLMVVPGWQARLPVGTVRSIPVLTHQQLISNPHALDVLMQTLLRDASSADG